MNNVTRITPDENYTPIITGDKVELLDSILYIQGDISSGKTTLAMNLITGLLTGEDDLNLSYKICPDDKVVVYLTTETSKYYLHKKLLKVLESIPEAKHDNLVFLSTNEITKEVIDEVEKNFSVYVLILDEVGFEIKSHSFPTIAILPVGVEYTPSLTINRYESNYTIQKGQEFIKACFNSTTKRLKRYGY